MLGLAVRSALLLALAWGLTAVLRRASASTRHFVWTCAFAAAALAPVAAWIAPGWRVAPPPPVASLAAAVAASPIAWSLRPAESPAEGGSPLPAADRMSGSFRSRPPVHPIIELKTVERGPIELETIALGVWATGTGLLLLHMLAGLLSARRLRRSAAPADARVLAEVRDLAEAFGVAPPAVLESAAIATPVVCGLWRPFVLLPPAARGWSDERRRAVLLHELAHVRRRDCLTQLCVQLVRAVYWFDPLAWIAVRRLRAEAERACDDSVLAAGTAGSAYAGHLLEIARGRQPARLSPFAAGALAMARRSQLEGRLMAILDPAVRRSSALASRCAAAGLAVLVSIPVAAVQLASPTAARPPRPPLPIAQDEGRLTLDESLVERAGDGDLAGVAALLAAGAYVDAECDGDGSPLIAAAADGHLDVVRLLLDRGADPNFIVRGDGAPLIAAASGGHRAVAELLLERGAQVDLYAPDDETALIQASGEGHLDVVRLLVAHGADVDLGVWVERWLDSDDGVRHGVGRQRNELRTPLGQARRGGHADVVAFLHSAGAEEVAR